MKSRSWWRTSKRLRRGYSLVEMVVVGFVLMVLMTAMYGLWSTAGRMSQAITAETDSDQRAAALMQRMAADGREGKQITILSPSSFRIYFPVADAAGNYDRTRLDHSRYVQYARTDNAGTAQASGWYVWRSTDASAGEAVAKGVQSLSVQPESANSVRLGVAFQSTEGGFSRQSGLHEQVLFLRNY